MGNREDRLNRQLDAAWKKLERAEKQDVKGYCKAITRSTYNTKHFLPVYKDNREAVEHNGRRPVCGKPHTMEEAQGYKFLECLLGNALLDDDEHKFVCNWC